jgi:hypothetical protein
VGSRSESKPRNSKSATDGFPSSFSFRADGSSSSPQCGRSRSSSATRGGRSLFPSHQPAVGGSLPQAFQLQPAGGVCPPLQPGAGAAQPLLIDGLVTAAQAATVRAMPEAVARMLVSQSGFPLTGLDPTFVVHGKLIVAAWAAESTRNAATVRALPAPIAAQIFMLMGVDTNWPTTLQDFFLDGVLVAGAAAPWAADPSQSQGILNPQRMAL